MSLLQKTGRRHARHPGKKSSRGTFLNSVVGFRVDALVFRARSCLMCIWSAQDLVWGSLHAQSLFDSYVLLYSYSLVILYSYTLVFLYSCTLVLLYSCTLILLYSYTLLVSLRHQRLLCWLQGATVMLRQTPTGCERLQVHMTSFYIAYCTMYMVSLYTIILKMYIYIYIYVFYTVYCIL